MWDRIAWLFRILWVCRISLLSGCSGLLLFLLAVPAQNLLEDLSFYGSVFSEIAFWSAVFVSTILFWALPIHFGARLTLDRDGWILSRAQANALSKAAQADVVEKIRTDHAGLIRWLPRLVGLLPFIALALGLYFSIQTDKGTSALQESDYTKVQALWLPIADGVSAILYLAAVIYRRQWVERMRFDGRQNELRALTIASVVITTLFFIAAYFAPLFISVYVPRALLIPPLFGSLVLALSWVQTYTYRTGVPLLLLLIVGALCVTASNVPFHALRTLPRQSPADERLPIEAAILRWKAANRCDPKPIACAHRPLVVAIDGGASRAAFTAATFVGGMLDRTTKQEGEAATPGRRLFAISGVSGGAYGAAVIQAALADAQTADTPEVAPCKTADRTWFGFAYRPRSEHRFRWQECLQALTSGDYLSPTIVGLAFRDFFAPRHWIEDRAVLLEQSWERHYDYTVHEHANPYAEGNICTDETQGGLCRRMGHPRAFLEPRPDRWIPLLLLNGTSVSTGRRIISSDVAVQALQPDQAPLFPESFDLAELMSTPCPPPVQRRQLGLDTATDVNAEASRTGKRVQTNRHGVCGGASPPDGDDIRLSTAALTSARFPLISPAGAFSMKDGRFGDRVVDGGYFENSGLTTAIEIVNALKAAQLDPLLVSISNEPVESDAVAVQKYPSMRASQTPGHAGLPPRPSTTPLAAPSDNGFFKRMFSTFEAPIEALVATRDGHASEAEGRAEAMFPHRTGFFRFHVDQTPELKRAPDADQYDVAYCTAVWARQNPPLSMAKVSMSWWLSALVQADLDAQKCSVGNQQTMNALMVALRK